MVQDRITDGKRIAQFLASELTGLETGLLAEIAVTDIHESAEASPDGTLAYRVERDGDAVASVVLYPEHAAVQRPDGSGWEVPEGLGKVEADGATLSIEGVAGVKQALDALEETLG